MDTDPSYYCPREGCRKFHDPGDEEYQNHRFLSVDNGLGSVDLVGMAAKHPSFRINPDVIDEQ